VPTTLVFYEGPSRVAASLADMAEVLGANREGALCREITKAFEEVRRGTLQELAAHYADLPAPKGEVVIVVGPPLQQEMSDDAVESALRDALKTQSVKEAATLLAEVTGRPRKELYQWALRMKDGA
ncbi:MAG: rRNA (cytidine-2'-O-)-methyltransferase, partial [Sphingomonadales bacterium]|nr:rRNA (cytidine-2'-O-)-methyltransferase [Sphingomonadales bacterium]